MFRFILQPLSLIHILEAAAEENSREEMEKALRLDLMLHALMLWQPGIPMLYSGDEVGQLNDPSYKQDPKKAGDSRYLHRGRFPWKLAEEAQKNKEMGIRDSRTG